ncbi:MAG: zinc-ribbon domain containing protein [Ruminococcus sp.]|nr:zinc-ribbon domain containing protein [Ruminococcus sp.]
MVTDEQRVETSRKNLEAIVRGGQIVIDSDSCMHENFNKFISAIIPMLHTYDRKIVIFDVTFAELCEYAKNESSDSKKVRQAIENVSRLANADIIRIMRLPDNETIVSKLQSFRKKGRVNMTFITQDKNKARAIIKSNTDTEKIEVRQINQYGFLSLHFVKKEAEKRPVKKAPFYVADDSKMYKGPFNCFISDYDFKENDIVYSDGVCLTLDKKIGEGGEGTIFSIVGTPGILVKIFNDQKVNNIERSFYSRKKVELLLESKIERRADICFPIAKVTDGNGNFIGYTMRQAEGISMNKLLIGSQRTIKQYFGENTSRKQTVELCISFLKAVKFLHDNGIVIGDIRTENIIVKSPTEITIIDTDSFQINEFTCPVGIALYTAPERINDNFEMINKSTFMNRKSDDCFAVATILFQILMPAKEPYSKSDVAEEDLEAIKNGVFAYPHPNMRKKETKAQAPKGNWRFCWSHIYTDIRVMMYETFMKDSEHYLPENRYTVDEWLVAFKKYYNRIISGEIEEYDPMSLDLIPIRFIKSRRLEYGKCNNPDCKLDIVSTKDLQKYHGYCYKCAHISCVFPCPICNQNDIVYKMIDELEGKPKPDKCFDCRQKELSTIYTTILCIDCGRDFDITFRDKEYFESKGYHLPKRCPECRSEAGKRVKPHRQNSAPDTSDNSSGSSYSNSGPSPSVRSFADIIRKILNLDR